MTQSILFVGGADLDGSVRQHLEQNGYAVSAVQDAGAAIELLAASLIDLVIVQLNESEHGTNLIKRLREAPETKVLAIAEWGTGQPTVALAAGADAYEPAPIDPDRLVEAVQRVLHKRAAAVGMND